MIKKIRSKFYLYPLLIGIYPIIALYNQNIDKLHLSSLYIPLMFTLAMCIALNIGLVVIFKNPIFAAFVTGLTMVIFFSHGHLHELIGGRYFQIYTVTIGTDRFLYIIWVTLYLTLFAYRKQLVSVLKGLTPFIKIFAIILTVLVLYPLTSDVITSSFERVTLISKTNTTSQFQTSEVVGKPDIYYIILDRYAGYNTLLNYYKYDNRDIYIYLEENGFVIPKDNYTNYPMTILSLTSSLNMEYIQSIFPNIEEDESESILYESLENSAVVKTLKDYGYTYHHLGSWFEPTKHNKNADYEYHLQNGFNNLDEFSLNLLDTTVFVPIARKLFPGADLLDFNTQHRARAEFQFATIASITKYYGPKFVFAHILLPHAPYVFNSDCSSKIVSDSENELNINYYTDHIKCVNRKIRELTESLLNDSTEKIIIFQSDEGPVGVNPNYGKDGYDLINASNDLVIERTSILNAIYVPEKYKIDVEKLKTPINTFRLIFNSLFNTNLEILPDDVYIMSGKKEMFNFYQANQRLPSM